MQSQKEQLDLALQAVVSSGDEVGRADLELENAKLRAELSALPDLKTELESLKARVTELSQLTGAGVLFLGLYFQQFKKKTLNISNDVNKE